jgi:anaerobic selenocysteine-containing dehydrogenase
MQIERRDFLKIFGSITGSAMLAGCGGGDVFDIPDELVAKAKLGPGIETWKNTVCGMCPAGCGIRVRLMDGLPVSVKGNPNFPINQGGVCPLGLNAVHTLYHPDRVKGPTKRISQGGDDRWEAVSWEEALKPVAEELIALRNEGKAHQVAFLGYNERGLMRQHITRFMQSYGSPNYFQFSFDANKTIPFLLLQGRSQIPAYDFLNTKLVLSLGADFLEDGYSPVHHTKLYSRHQETQTRYIQVESRMSLTAANADRWIAIRPGTYGALALGIAYVLIREELYDSEFVKLRTFGFEDWVDPSGVKRVGFKHAVLGNYFPERVSEITGIPTATLLELARDLGNTKPSLVIGDRGSVNNLNGTFNQMAVQSLNALLGNFEKEGGVLFVEEPPFTKLPVVRQDEAARNGNKQVPIARSRDGIYPLADFSIESFTQNVLSGQPYPISILFMLGGNPAFQSLNRKDFEKALQRIPLVVSFDSVMSETSKFAHIILPEHTFLERWGEVSNVPSISFTHVGIQQPVVTPLQDTKHAGDVICELAGRLGGIVGSSVPFKSYEGYLKESVQGVYKSGEGAITTEGTKQNWIEYLRQRGWHIGRYESFDEFWSQMLEHGGWWNPVRKRRSWPEIFPTPSGKFEFYSQRLKSVIDGMVRQVGAKNAPVNLDLVLNKLGISARGDTVFIPHHEPVPYESDLPFHLITFHLLPNRDGQSANLPMMQEMLGHQTRQYWRSWVEIHPESAARVGLVDGQWVWVESSVGRLKVQIKISPRVMPNVVAIPFGLGHTSYGRYATGRGINPHSILRNLNDTLSGTPALEGTKVRITSVS